MRMTLLAGFVATAVLALFNLALKRAWFSRFRNGFLATVVVTVAGTGIGAVSLLAAWTYESARQVLTEQTLKQLDTVGRMVESGIAADLQTAMAQMANAAPALEPAVRAKDAARAAEALREIRRLDARFLRLDVFDQDGRPLTDRNGGDPGELVKVAVAFGLEGKPFRRGPYFSPEFHRTIVHLAVPMPSAQGAPAGVLAARYDIEDALSSRFSATRFGDTGYAVIVNSQGRIVAHPDPARRGDDVSRYQAVRAALAGKQGVEIEANKAGEERLFFYRPLKSESTVDAENLAVLTEMREDEAAAPARRLLHQFYIGLAIVLLGALALGVRVSAQVRRPLTELVGFVQRVKAGDLTARLARGGRDEIARLAGAMDEMVQGLEERDRVKEVFGRYVTTQVSERVLKGHLNLGGESRRVTILFSDIRDFTTISEQMSPTEVVTFLNAYFSEMVDAVFQYSGVLDKFIGDGMMAVFGSFGDAPDHPKRAVQAALRMKALLAKINGERGVAGKPPIRIGIGIHTDEVIVGNIGSRKRLEYTVIGDGVNTTSRVEKLNKDFGTTILITESTFAEVKDAFECRLMPEAKLKGKTRPIQSYEVLSAKTAEPDGHALLGRTGAEKRSA